MQMMSNMEKFGQTSTPFDRMGLIYSLAGPTLLAPLSAACIVLNLTAGSADWY